jgi:Icc-related predicted phosphoesterase
MKTLVLMSDTHGYHGSLDVPMGDILIHAGDLTQTGSLEELEEANAFLAGLPHRHKVVICGNHDFCFERDPVRARAALTAATYLQDSAVVVEGIKIWGSPWQPWFYDWAFNLKRGPAIAAKWALIPKDTDILVTHGPPYGIGDQTSHGERAGCEDLLARIEKVRPKLHVFGHIHEGAGIYRRPGTTFVNAATDEGSGPVRCLAWPLED